MKTFNEYKQTILKEGGNTLVYDRSGKETSAGQIPLAKIGRKTFVNRFNEVMFKINDLFYKDHKRKLWMNDSLITKAIVYNGSTSYVSDLNKYNDTEILMSKPTMGDVDIVIKRDDAQDLILL